MNKSTFEKELQEKAFVLNLMDVGSSVEKGLVNYIHVLKSRDKALQEAEKEINEMKWKSVEDLMIILRRHFGNGK